MNRARLLAAFGVTAALIVVSSFADQVVLKNGLNGYSGQYDFGMVAGGWGADGFTNTNRWTGMGPDTVAIINAGGTYVARALMRFNDLDQVLPAGVTITNAVLEIEVSSGANQDYRIYRALQDWGPSSAYWAAWGSGGGDPGYTGTLIGQGSGGGGTRQFTLDASVVNEWHVLPAENFGMVIRLDSANGDHSAIREFSHADSAKLTIQYDPDHGMAVLQNGLNGYNDEFDYCTHARSWEPPGHSTTARWYAVGADLVPVISTGGEAKGLVRFGGIENAMPAGATILSAALELNVGWSCCGGGDFVVYQALQPWGPSNAYWLAWGNGGTDPGYTGAVVGQGPSADGVNSIDLSPTLVQEWLLFPEQNFGMVVRLPDPTGRHTGFYEYDSPSPPRLTVTYSTATRTAVFQNGRGGYTGQANDQLGASENRGAYSSWGGSHNPYDLFAIGAGDPIRTLVRFDLDDVVPKGSPVHAATLRLYGAWAAGEGDEPLVFNRALQPWVNDATYWLNWGNGGADPGYTGEIVATYSNAMGAGVWRDIPLTNTAVVQAWTDDPGNNNGMLMSFPVVVGGVPHWQVYGETNTVNGLAPQLVLEYTPADVITGTLILLQ